MRKSTGYAPAVGHRFFMCFHAVLTRQFRPVDALNAPPSQPVLRTGHPAPAAVGDVRADYGGRDLPAAAARAGVLVPEQFQSFPVARNP